MYADEKMLDLLAASDALSPEELYHAWYDRIDSKHLDGVTEVVQKLTSGEFAEIQYPWIHPKFGTVYVRLGGVRNMEYKNGVRLEGCCQDVTNLVRIQKQMQEQTVAISKSKVVSDLLVEQFMSVYYVNLVDESLEVFLRSNDIMDGTGRIPDYYQAISLYILECVHPDDRENMLRSVKVPYIREHLRKNAAFSCIMRDISGAKTRYFRFRVARGLDDDHVIFSFMDVTESVLTRWGAERAENVVDVLASDYVAVLSTNLETTETHLEFVNEWFTKMTSVAESDGENSRSFGDWMKLFAEKIVCREDQEFFLKGVERDRFKDKVVAGNAVNVEFRTQDGGAYRHMMLKIIPSNVDSTHHIVVGLRDIEDEFSAKEEAEKERLRNHEIIGALASEYSSVYYINLNTEEIIPYAMNQATESALGKVFTKDITYSKALDVYAETLVSLKDRAMLLSASSIENVKSQLKNRKSFETIYENVIGHYCEMKFVKVGWDPTPQFVALGFADKDVELRQQYENRKYSEIANALSREFETIYYVNLEDDTFDEFNARGAYATLNIRTMGQDFFNEAKYNLKLVCCPDDLDRMTEVIDKRNLLSQIQESKIFSVEYRLMMDGKPIYFRLKALKALQNSNCLIVAVANVDEEVKERLRHQQDLEQNLEIIDVLASEYSSVYYVNLETDMMTMYTMNADTENKFGQIFTNGVKYSDVFKLYVEKLTYEADRQMMMMAGSIENIKRRLENQKTFVTIYRSDEGGYAHYCEMKFVKVGRVQDRPTAVTLCFADKDKEILNRYVDSKVYEDYFGIYFVNLESDVIRVVRQSQVYEEGKAYEFSKYSERLMDFSKVVTPEYRHLWEQMANIEYMRELLAEEDRREFTYRAIAGEWRRCTVLVMERKDGVPVSLVLTFMFIDNVTAQKLELDAKIAEQKKALEDQQVMLEQALVRAEAASKAKTSFLSNMSHDIRTPMNAIIGFTNLAMKALDDRQRVMGYLSKTAISSQHLLSLINDILDMSRIESGKIQLEEVNCNLAEIMHDLNTIILGQSQAKQQNLFMESYDITDEDVVCDKLRLHQVLINLLSNAVKFTPVGGDIRVSIRQISRGIGTAAYEFRVKDNGIGMDKMFLNKLYEPFEREKTSTISKMQGTGLGMSITKNIIDMMGGTIDVESTPGKGTEFVIHLTLSLQEKGRELAPITDLQNTRALVVDDDFYACSCAADLLERLGVHAEWTTNGKEAIMKVQDVVAGGDSYSVYIIDWVMPDMNGVEIVRQIRKMIGADIPIIVMTAYDWSFIEEEAHEAGVTAFMSKPLFLSELHRTLSRVVGIFMDEVKAESKPQDIFEGKRVLLVEDNEMNREIAKTLLEDAKFIVDVAEDGNIAVDKMMAAPPEYYSIVLMDVQMPVMDGYEATRRIRALERREIAEIPIIAMTANAFEDDRKAALNAGMNEHVVKPIDMDKLKETMRQFL